MASTDFNDPSFFSCPFLPSLIHPYAYVTAIKWQNEKSTMAN